MDASVLPPQAGPPDEAWDVAVLNQRGDVFVTSEGGEATLPVVRVSGRTRVVPQIASTLTHQYGLEVFCLTDLVLPGSDGQSSRRTMLAEMCAEARTLPMSSRWSDPGAIKLDDNRRLSEVIQDCLRHRRETERPGFWTRLQEWVASVLMGQHPTRAWAVTGCHSQWNAAHGFCLTRLETSGSAVWFKAVGPPNEAECCITAMLAKWHPRQMPRLLATHEPWDGWLTEEVSGRSLRHGAGHAAWVSVAREMSRLQLAECNRAESWLQSGCLDLRAATLDRKVADFVNGMEPIFDRQAKPSPPRLSRTQLQTMADALHRAFEAAACIPSTLVHADLNPDNVFVPDGRAVFLDWAGASVGFPFAALENVCGHLRRFDLSDPAAHEVVRDSYYRVWRDAHGTAVIDRALAVAPLVRYASLAMRSAGWLWGTSAPTRVEPLLRSLARSMCRAGAVPGQ